MGDHIVLKIIYSLFVGILLALFVGVGIETFYPSPKSPVYPSSLTTYSDKGPTAEQTKTQQEYDTLHKKYDAELRSYSRNVSIIALVFAVVFLVLSLVFESRMKVLADGIMLGGLFTLIYAIIRGFIGEDSKYLFVVISVSIVAVLGAGYRRFVSPPAPDKSVK